MTLPPLCIRISKTLRPWSAQFPNYFGHMNVTDVQDGLAMFNGILRIAREECTSMLAHFLCPMYAPSCTSSKTRLPPCREFCLQARSKCKRDIKQLGKENGFRWPTDLKCKNFPRKGSSPCYMGPTTEVAGTSSPALGKFEIEIVSTVVHYFQFVLKAEVCQLFSV